MTSTFVCRCMLQQACPYFLLHPSWNCSEVLYRLVIIACCCVAMMHRRQPLPSLEPGWSQDVISTETETCKFFFSHHVGLHFSWNISLIFLWFRRMEHAVQEASWGRNCHQWCYDSSSSMALSNVRQHQLPVWFGCLPRYIYACGVQLWKSIADL